MPTTYDVIVIGGGPAGENAADYAAQHGLDVALVERDLVGGECSYWGCMPSKALLRPGDVLAAARAVPAAAAAAAGNVDVRAALASRDAFTSGWDDTGQADWVASVGATLVRGHARLAGERLVDVTEADGRLTRLEARVGVVIAVGTRAAVPPIDGLADAGVWDNRDATTVKEIPDRIAVLGGGVIGLEMAQAFRRLGAAEVTIIEAEDRLLGTEEPFAGEEVGTALRREGVRIELGARAVQVSRDDATGVVRVRLEDGGAVDADELLVAVGRRAATDELGLDRIGVQPRRGGYLEVDDHLRVPGHPWLSVVGDANGRALLTHQGKYQARLVGDRLGGVQTDPAWADRQALPRVVFTDPKVAAVGLTEAQARQAGHDVLAVTHDVGHTAGGALLGKGVSGTAKLVVDRQQRTVLGMTLVGPMVGEMLHAATVAIVSGITIERLWHAVPPFPTMSEVWLRLLERIRATEQAR